MIRKRNNNRKTVIDLTGPDGNAFYLLAQAKFLCKSLELDYEKICGELTCGDYENLIKTFDKYFGEFVILER